MNYILAILTTASLAVCAALPAGAQDDLLARMSAINPNLRTFTADMHVNVAMKSFPFMNFALDGTYYHQAPDKDKVVFTSGVPAVAQQFDKLYAHIEPPSRWLDLYDVKVVSDDGTITTYRLKPRKQGNVDHIDARASDRRATVQWLRWNYVNGGYAELTNHYTTVDGNLVVASQNGHVDEPGYTADITSTIDRYKINAQISDGTFSQ